MFQTTLNFGLSPQDLGTQTVANLLVMFLPVIAGEKCWELLVFCPAE